MRAQGLSHVQLLVTPWTVARQAPLSLGFPSQEHWTGLPFPSPGIEPASSASPALADGFFTAALPGKTHSLHVWLDISSSVCVCVRARVSVYICKVSDSTLGSHS